MAASCVPWPIAPLTVVEVMAAYMRHARGYYRKVGRLTSEYAGIICSIRLLKELYGHHPVGDFCVRCPCPAGITLTQHESCEARRGNGVTEECTIPCRAR
jgi:hypothetical protein